jgi:hypothetical protein
MGLASRILATEENQNGTTDDSTRESLLAGGL